MPALDFERDGAERVAGALDAAVLRRIVRALPQLAHHQAGTRLHGVRRLRPILAATGPVGRIAAERLGSECRPVRAILFDKTPDTNWSLPWHQDQVIAVRSPREVEGFAPWTIKSGLHHVVPPFGLMAGMVTLRIHLDPVPASNAPLLVVPGSHRLGRITTDQADAVAEQYGSVPCMAEAGDVWLYATPILHGSATAEQPSHRRVLQVDYAATALPGGLMWLGV
ncbi:MAG TPA: phytanoyl-CoA dioxygenase family protein [Stellaceae bacterium]|nr:phytanoyl-CoA dioxygenase family protein [Stellaceae bacterium]